MEQPPTRMALVPKTIGLCNLAHAFSQGRKVVFCCSVLLAELLGAPLGVNGADLSESKQLCCLMDNNMSRGTNLTPTGALLF